MHWVIPILIAVGNPAAAAPSLEAPLPEVVTYEKLPGHEEETGFQLRLALRGTGELWQDTAVTSVYRNGAFGGGIAMIATIWGPFALDL